MVLGGGVALAGEGKWCDRNPPRRLAHGAPKAMMRLPAEGRRLRRFR